MPQADAEHRLGSQDELEELRNFRLAEAKMHVAPNRVEQGTATAADYETLKPWEALALGERAGRALGARADRTSQNVSLRRFRRRFFPRRVRRTSRARWSPKMPSMNWRGRKPGKVYASESRRRGPVSGGFTPLETGLLTRSHFFWTLHSR
jgi:hypothetical protein